MALPRLDTPTYEITIPSSGVITKYRPFLVKEQKVLMMAQESDDVSNIANTITELVASCTDGGIDAQRQPVFDIEYLFMKIRAKSVGETAKVSVLCPDDGKTKVSIDIKLDEIETQMFDEHTNVVSITDKINLIMRYPTLKDYAKYSTGGDAAMMFEMINHCINEMHFDDKIYKRVDVSDKEVQEFVDQMNTQQFQSVVSFFETMPRLRHEITVVNPKTKVESTVLLEGLQSFLG